MNLARRPYRDGIELSVLGFGGMLAVGMKQESVNRLTADAVDRGINYFDVAPFYGDGEAEKKMGIALEPFRSGVFLACKSLERSGTGLRVELNRSLKRLHTTYFDLYQYHAVTSLDEVGEIFGPGGAAEALLEARDQGKVRFVGFSAHSVDAALAMLDRFQFDSVLFPVNYVCYASGNFGPQVLRKAREKGTARLALKSMALGPWRRREARRYAKCWYRPVEDPVLARSALRFTLSEDVTAAIPPGEEPLFRMALDLASDLPPLSPEERQALLDSTRGMKPLLSA